MPARPRRLLTFHVRVEERDDPAAGIVRGRLVIPGVSQPCQEVSNFARLAPGLMQERVSGFRVHLDVVLDPQLSVT